GAATRRSELPTVRSPSLLEETPPLSVCFAPGLRLDLAPVVTFARPIRGIAALAHHPLEATLFGHAQQRQAVFERLASRGVRIIVCSDITAVDDQKKTREPTLWTCT